MRLGRRHARATGLEIPRRRPEVRDTFLLNQGPGRVELRIRGEAVEADDRRPRKK